MNQHGQVKLQFIIDDAENAAREGSVGIARAIYAHALSIFPENTNLWMDAVQLEKAHGTFESIDQILKSAAETCPEDEIFWLMRAKETWLSGNVEAAKSILEQAFAANPNSEEIWLAAIKLEVETGAYDRAQVLLKNARLKADTDRVWMKSITLER